ncbi:hypothetical protein BDDG_12708, partial [Blastomyces dermatitidis ATCC 18188]
SSHIDRSAFTDDSELNVESLIENLKNMIMKKLSVSYVIRSFVSLSTSSVSFSVTSLQSSTPASVSDSLTLTISVSVILTFTTSAFSDFVISTFITSSFCFKKILHRLDESHFSVFALTSEIILIKDDNTAETTSLCSQASSVTFSSLSVRKVVRTSDHKHLMSDDFCCYSSDSVSSSSSVSSISALSALTSDSAGPALFFNFSM